MDLAVKVKKTIRVYQMLQAEDAVLTAVSGGPDSVALMFLLHQLRSCYGFRLGVCHLHHGLRTQAGQEMLFVKNLTNKLGLPFFARYEDVHAYQKAKGLSLEEAAREVRYAFFNELCTSENFNKIALGHHQDDNAESVLLFLLRGSGRSGLGGMLPVRDARFIRPLLEVSRADILTFLDAKGIKFMQDHSNQDLSFQRNRIRHHLLPILQDYNPAISANLNRMANIMREEETWMEEQLQPLYLKAILKKGRDRIIFSGTFLKEQPLAVCRRIIRKGLEGVKKNLRRISFEHIDAIMALMQGRGSLNLPDNLLIQYSYEQLSIGKTNDFNFEYSIFPPGEIFIPEIKARMIFTKIKTVPPSWPAIKYACFDLDYLSYPLIIRSIRPGDRFIPFGMTGSKKIKKFLIDAKIPLQERHRHPVVLSGDKIIWIAGLRTHADFKIQSVTKKILKAEFLLV